MFADNEKYRKSIKFFAQKVNIDYFKGKSFLIVGANGLIGTYFIDLLMYLNKYYKTSINIVVMGRKESSIKERFSAYIGDSEFEYVLGDITNGFIYEDDVDYLINLASNTHPKAYATEPIATLMTNIQGSYNLLAYAAEHVRGRVLFTSSVEIYGKALSGQEVFTESDCGYIDCNTLRACYNEGKRAGEALCQAFKAERGVDIVVARLSRIYGPTMKMDDSKALSQFIKNALAGEDIVLKSAGEQNFSYLYVADAVIAMLYLLQHGESGEAYNVADKKSDVKLKVLANILAEISGTSVKFEGPDSIEQSGYSTADKAILCSDKINWLGWKSTYSLEDGLRETLKVFEK